MEPGKLGGSCTTMGVSVEFSTLSDSQQRGDVQGQLKYEVVAGRTNLTYAYATYPLKFLHPRRTIRQGFDTFVTYLLGYGGGLVGGDVVALECEVTEGASVVLCTQATTKVFKAQGAEGHVQQTFSFEIGRSATLAVLPDPITCFERARYRQRQEIRLAQDATLVFVDWLTSGRKRNFLASGSLQNDRHETHEHWDFDEYDSTADIYVDNQLVLSDRVRLVDEEVVSMRKRMHGTHVLGLLVLLGDRVKVITDRLLDLSQRKRLHHANEITPQGRLSSQSDFKGVIASASPLTGNGVIVRFVAEDTESGMNYLKDILEPLKEILGHTPYQENR
ncbi:hypothetical protein Poli38472_008487 [Pythium oligandrum]|uniref:Urease accessory protein D n=1 Tax=Pythium oligandrum TaxID=41045 RepID=A0A8K1C3J6_PYTOL|nr:hypothetical protein Poli38472_008487 [Pythium oligandrum]|eukprot:TMW55839.1 hypothetical protein Poli38472_008487 [Pythium oligandrum]